MWTWSELDEQQVRRVEEVEDELAGDYVVAYREAEPGHDRPIQVRMTPAMLDEDQLRRVRDLERDIGCVAVAYEQD
ncbi:MAG TPA: hypothetical protein VF802_02195 [Candidatus Limnocylindrales bacterium]